MALKFLVFEKKKLKNFRGVKFSDSHCIIAM